MKITNLNDIIICLNEETRDGLEEIVFFPNAIVSDEKSAISNSIFIYPRVEHHRVEHQYRPQLLSDKIGRGLIGLIIKDIDYKKITDELCETLKGTGIISREDTFLTVCSSLSTFDEVSQDDNYKIIFLSAYAKNSKVIIPHDITSALEQMKQSVDFRQQMSDLIAKQIGSSFEVLSDWCYNSVEVTKEHVIYRKDVLKLNTGKVYPLFSGLNSTIMLYLLDEKGKPTPYSSLPYRNGKERAGKDVSEEYIDELKQIMYIPDCVDKIRLKQQIGRYGKYDRTFFRNFSNSITPLGSSKILSYITGI